MSKSIKLMFNKFCHVMYLFFSYPLRKHRGNKYKKLWLQFYFEYIKMGKTQCDASRDATQAINTFYAEFNIDAESLIL